MLLCLLPASSLAQKSVYQPSASDADALAAQVNSLPVYSPHAVPAGVIHCWGHVFLKQVLAEWEAGFAQLHPGVTFDDLLVSSAAATGALFTHTAEIGILGREIRPMEVAGYTRVMKHKPAPIEVMSGSWANADKSVALGIFVHQANPIKQLTFAQLDAIFGSEHLGGAKQNIRTWGDLGLSGLWAARPIHVYVGELDAAPGFFFSQTVMGKSLLWNGELHHFDDITRADGTIYEAQQQIVDALAADPDGIALSGAGVINPKVKLLAIGKTKAGPFTPPSYRSALDRTYPLSRSVWIYTNDAPGSPLDARTREFLRYILSREGQQAVVREHEYLPLTPALAAEQRKRLE